MEHAHDQPRELQTQLLPVEETLSFHVEADGSNEASMRQQLKNKKMEDLRRSRDFQRTRGGKTAVPRKGGGSLGALQKAAEFQDENNRGV